MFEHNKTNVRDEISTWAAQNENVRVVILSSSRTNPNAPVDMLSDYDIELFVQDLKPFLKSDRWLEGFGAILVRWPHKPPDNEDHTTRLVLYKDAPRIDFQIKMLDILADIVSASDLPEFYDIGYEVVLDKDGITKGLKPPTHTAFRTKQPTESEYDELVNHFWWNVTYVAKYLYRDELFFAKYTLDGSLHHKYLSTAIAWYIGMNSNWDINPGVYGRWFKRYLDPETWAAIEATFAGAGLEENWNAMFKTTEMFGRLASEVGVHLGYTYPIELDRNVTAYLAEIRKLSEKRE